MEDLIYCHFDRTAFIICNQKVEPDNVLELIKTLDEGMNNFKKLTGVKKEEISTFVIQPYESINFAGRRVFYAKMKSAPQGAIEKKANYDMALWIKTGK